MAAGDPMVVRELSHVLILILVLLWIVFSVQFNFHRLNYKHLFNLSFLRWSLPQVYGATVARSLCDKWFLLLSGTLSWWYFYMGLPRSASQIVVAFLSIFLFGLVLVSWINVFRSVIDYSFRSRFWKWTSGGMGLALFLAANLVSIYTKVNADVGTQITNLLKAGQISVYLVLFPPGLFTEILYSFNEGNFQITAVCLVGLLVYLWAGIKAGSLLVGNMMERTGGKLSGIDSWSNRNTLPERAGKWVESIVPDRYIPILVQELAYLIRWKRVKVLVALFVFIFACYFFRLGHRPRCCWACVLSFFQ